MPKTLGNILTGHVNLYIKAYAGDDTDNPITGNTVSWAGWGLGADAAPIGFQSEDGLDMEYAAEFFEIKVAAHNAPVRRDLIGESLTTKITLQESSLAQLQYAMAGATYTAAAVAGTNPNLLSLGDKAVIGQWAVGFQGIATTGQALVGYIRKVDSIAAIAISHRKGAVRGIPLEFGSLADPLEAAGETLAMIWELTAAVPAQTTLDSPGLSFGEEATITVADTSDFTSSGDVIINGETIAYTGKTSTTFTTLTRGGVPLDHGPGSIVIQG